MRDAPPESRTWSAACAATGSEPESAPTERGIALATIQADCDAALPVLQPVATRNMIPSSYAKAPEGEPAAVSADKARWAYW